MLLRHDVFHTIKYKRKKKRKRCGKSDNKSIVNAVSNSPNSCEKTLTLYAIFLKFYQIRLFSADTPALPSLPFAMYPTQRFAELLVTHQAMVHSQPMARHVRTQPARAVIHNVPDEVDAPRPCHARFGETPPEDSQY
jgi:hypothetical protein